MMIITMMIIKILSNNKYCDNINIDDDKYNNGAR